MKSDYKKLQLVNEQLKITVSNYLPICDNPSRPLVGRLAEGPIPMEVKEGKLVMPNN